MLNRYIFTTSMLSYGFSYILYMSRCNFKRYYIIVAQFDIEWGDSKTDVPSNFAWRFNFLYKFPPGDINFCRGITLFVP